MFGSTFAIVTAVIAVLTVFLAVWRAVVMARTPEGAVAWGVFLLAAPWFALPLYIVFGRHKFRRYESSRRTSRQLSSEMESSFRDLGVVKRTDPLCRPFERLARMPVTSGNSVGLLIDGDRTFDAIFAAIDAARAYVCVQFYTIADDGIGRRLSERMIAAAGRGVTVRVIYDGVGSHSLPASYRTRLREAGIAILDPRQIRGPTQRFNVNFRNHRKTVVVDGEVGFLGGHNVSDLYLGHGAPGDHWRDTHVELRGPAVAQLQAVFFEDWHWATDEVLSDALDWSPEVQPDDLSVLILPFGPADEMDTGSLFFFSAIAAARTRIWLASPYFVPDEALLAALKAAALRGCDVRLMVPAAPDHYITWFAAFAYFDEIAAAGVSIYRYGPGFMHQKALVLDERMAAIGTANLDNRSFRLNFETMALVFDEDFTTEVASMLAEDFESCSRGGIRTRDQRWTVRLIAPFARLLSPIL